MAARSFYLRLPILFAIFFLAGAATSVYAADGDLTFASLGDFKLTSGELLRDCKLGYRTFGALNADKSNAILFPTWFTGKTSELTTFAGASKMLDPAKYFIVLIDAFANGVSSSPSNSASQRKEQFPAITIRDMVNAEYLLATKTLGLKHVRAVMGISMGGMQTFQWAVSYPDFMDKLIPIVGTPRQTSHDLLLWATEVRSIHSHLLHNDEAHAVDEAALISYLNLTSPANIVAHLKPEDVSAEIEKTIKEDREHSDPYDYLRQLDAMIHHDISSDGSMEDATRAVRAKMLVIVGRQDHMVNPAPALQFADFAGARVLILEGDCGHIATVCQSGVMNPVVREFLDEQ